MENWWKGFGIGMIYFWLCECFDKQTRRNNLLAGLAATVPFQKAKRRAAANQEVWRQELILLVLHLHRRRKICHGCEQKCDVSFHRKIWLSCCKLARSLGQLAQFWALQLEQPRWRNLAALSQFRKFSVLR